MKVIYYRETREKNPFYTVKLQSGSLYYIETWKQCEQYLYIVAPPEVRLDEIKQTYQDYNLEELQAVCRATSLLFQLK